MNIVPSVEKVGMFLLIVFCIAPSMLVVSVMVVFCGVCQCPKFMFPVKLMLICFCAFRLHVNAIVSIMYNIVFFIDEMQMCLQYNNVENSVAITCKNNGF